MKLFIFFAVIATFASSSHEASAQLIDSNETSKLASADTSPVDQRDKKRYLRTADTDPSIDTEERRTKVQLRPTWKLRLQKALDANTPSHKLMDVVKNGKGRLPKADKAKMREFIRNYKKAKDEKVGLALKATMLEKMDETASFRKDLSREVHGPNPRFDGFFVQYYLRLNEEQKAAEKAFREWQTKKRKYKVNIDPHVDLLDLEKARKAQGW